MYSHVVSKIVNVILLKSVIDYNRLCTDTDTEAYSYCDCFACMNNYYYNNNIFIKY